MIERLSRRAIAVCRACRKQQGIALGIQRAPTVGLKQNCRGRIAAQHDLAAGIAGRVEQMHRAARRYRGAGYRDAQLAHVMARQRHVSGRRLDQSRIRHQPCFTVGPAARGHLVATGRRYAVGVGRQSLADDEAVSGGQQRLAARRRDLTGIVRLPPQEQHVAAALGNRLGLARLYARACFHAHVARRLAERRGVAGAGQIVAEGRRHPLLDPAVHLRAVDALPELRIAHAHRGGDQVAGIDLAGAAEHDAVPIHDHDRASRVDLPLDLAGAGLGIVHPIQHRPGRFLFEGHRRLAANVEGLPVQDGALAGLFHRDDGTAIHLSLRLVGQRLGVLPTPPSADCGPPSVRLPPFRQAPPTHR